MNDGEKIRNPETRPHPPGRVKIANALRSLLKDKEFDAITTAGIAVTAGVNEALIYRYFGDKRGLLHQVLYEFLEEYVGSIEKDLDGIKGSLNRLCRLIWHHIHMFESNRVFAKLLLLEVRSFPGYFGGHYYGQVKRYSNILLGILEEGMKNGDIQDDIPIRSLRQVVIGGIEHICLPEVIFERDFSAEQLRMISATSCSVGLPGTEMPGAKTEGRDNGKSSRLLRIRRSIQVLFPGFYIPVKTRWRHRLRGDSWCCR